MNKSNLFLFCWLVTAILLTCPIAAFPQSAQLGIVKYTAFDGWTQTVKPNIVAMSTFDQKTGKYCILTLYGATTGTGSPSGDFSRDWAKLVVAAMKAEASPKTETQMADGWTITAAGSEVESEVGKAVGLLTVISGYGQTVSILAVFNDPNYVKQVETFIGAIDLDKPAAPAPAGPAYVDGKLVIPLPSRQLTISDLVGKWGEDAQRISTTYVYRSSGSYAGSDSIAYRMKMEFTGNGGYLNDFFGIRNGEKIIDKSVGTFAVNGRVLSIKHKDTAKYVIRGWLELPDMTILKVCGPWFNDDEIEQRAFDDPGYGINIEKIWVRKK